MSFNTAAERKFAQSLHNGYIRLNYRWRVLFLVVKNNPDFYPDVAVKISDHVMKLLKQKKFENNLDKYDALRKLVVDLIDKRDPANIIENFIESNYDKQNKNGIRSKLFCCCDDEVDQTKKFLQQYVQSEHTPFLSSFDKNERWAPDVEVIYIKTEAKERISNALLTHPSIVEFCINKINAFIDLRIKAIADNNNSETRKFTLKQLKLNSQERYQAKLNSLYGFCDKLESQPKLKQLLLPNHPSAKGLKDFFNKYLKDAYNQSIKKEEVVYVALKPKQKKPPKITKKKGKRRKIEKKKKRKRDKELKKPSELRNGRTSINRPGCVIRPFSSLMFPQKTDIEQRCSIRINGFKIAEIGAGKVKNLRDSKLFRNSFNSFGELTLTEPVIPGEIYGCLNNQQKAKYYKIFYKQEDMKLCVMKEISAEQYRQLCNNDGCASLANCWVNISGTEYIFDEKKLEELNNSMQFQMK